LWSTSETTQSISIDSSDVGIATVLYSVTVTSNGCEAVDYIDVTYDICSDINDNMASEPIINMYPNPNNGNVFISFDGFEDDGKFEYSDIVMIKYESSVGLVPNMNIFPNPVSKENDLFIDLKGFDTDKEVLVVVLDILGKELYSKVIFTDTNGETVSAIDPHKNLPKGTYIIIGSSDNNVFKKKLIIK